MGHYLSDMLPDPAVVCLNCMEGVYPEKQVIAWGGYLHTCECKKPNHCPVKDVKVTETKSGFKWSRKTVTRSHIKN